MQAAGNRQGTAFVAATGDARAAAVRSAAEMVLSTLSKAKAKPEQKLGKHTVHPHSAVQARSHARADPAESAAEREEEQVRVRVRARARARARVRVRELELGLELGFGLTLTLTLTRYAACFATRRRGRRCSATPTPRGPIGSMRGATARRY